MKCNKQYLFHMLHIYYDRHEQILTPGKLYNTKTCTVDTRRHNGHRRYLIQLHIHTTRHFGCTAEESVRHIGSAAEVSGHFGSIPLLPICPAAEVSCCRSVRTPMSPHDNHARVTTVSYFTSGG